MWTINYIEWKSSSSFWHGSWRGMSFIHNVRCSQSSLNVIFRLQVCSISPSLSLLLTHFFVSPTIQVYVWVYVSVSVSWILVLILAGIPEFCLYRIHFECAIRRYVFHLFNLTPHVCSCVCVCVILSFSVSICLFFPCVFVLRFTRIVFRCSYSRYWLFVWCLRILKYMKHWGW